MRGDFSNGRAGLQKKKAENILRVSLSRQIYCFIIIIIITESVSQSSSSLHFS